MYERFTDPARNVMQRANQEAQHFNHEYIRTEHILLGIIGKGTGAAVSILKNLCIELPKVTKEIESIIRSDSYMVTYRRPPQTPPAKKVIEYAMEEAHNLGHNSIGTEHLLLGLLREKEGVAGQVLMTFGVHLDDVRNEIAKLTGREPGAPNPKESHSQFGPLGLGGFVAKVGWSIGLSPRSANRSDFLPVDSRELEAEIERLTVAKEEAIAKMDFQLAARLRDQADELKRKRIR